MTQFMARAWTGVRTYLYDKEQNYSRIIYFSRWSMLINAAIGLGKIMMGFYNHSFLFFVSGFYNIGLSLAKAVAIKGYGESKGKKIWPFVRRADSGLCRENKNKEYRCYQVVGMIVLLASLAYMIGSINVFTGDRSNTYFGSVLVVAVGSVIAFEIIISLQGVHARRREEEPILEAIKLTSFVSSLIGLVLFQTVILGHLGQESNIYFDLIGIFLGAVSVCIGIYMVVFTEIKAKTPLK